MDVCRWRRAFLTTFDRNHGRKCGKSSTLKASCIRNLFDQGRRWMENSIATFWGDRGKTPGANVQTSGATTLRLTRRSLCDSFWLLRWRQSSPILPTRRTSPPVVFSIPEDKIEAQGETFCQHWRDPDRMAGCDEGADAKWLPAVLPIMEIPLGSLYKCHRWLLRRGWGEYKFR